MKVFLWPTAESRPLSLKILIDRHLLVYHFGYTHIDVIYNPKINGVGEETTIENAKSFITDKQPIRTTYNCKFNPLEKSIIKNTLKKFGLDYQYY